MPIRHTLPLLIGLLLALPAQAEKADRSKPVSIEADQNQNDLRNNRTFWKGGVIIRQGTLLLEADTVTAIQDTDGFRAATATGSHTRLVHFRQKKDSANEYMEGWARQAKLDGHTGIVTLTGEARVRSGLQEARGDVIEYDDTNQSYSINWSPDTPIRQDSQRARAVFQPTHPGAAQTVREAVYWRRVITGPA